MSGAKACRSRHAASPRRLDRHGVCYHKRDNVLVDVSDLKRAQKLADGFASIDWVCALGRYARRGNPLLRDLLAPMQYCWVTSQAEYATDVLFRSPHQALKALIPWLLTYSTLGFEAREVRALLGRKVHGNFHGDGHERGNARPAFRVDWSLRTCAAGLLLMSLTIGAAAEPASRAWAARIGP